MISSRAPKLILISAVFVAVQHIAPSAGFLKPTRLQISTRKMKKKKKMMMMIMIANQLNWLEGNASDDSAPLAVGMRTLSKKRLRRTSMSPTLSAVS
jgi:hypothetical protein